MTINSAATSCLTTAEWRCYFAPMNSIATSFLTEPRYTTPEVLAVTLLKPEVLQTWINREVFGERNPGRGQRRLYSKIDIVKLSIMRRMADLSVALSVSIEIATAAAEQLAASAGEFDWNLYISLRPKTATAQSAEVVTPGGALAKYDPVYGDPFHMRVSHFVEVFDGVFSRRSKPSLADVHAGKAKGDDRPIDPERRKQLARNGIHAEPVIIFPLGEVVNGALLQLLAFDEQEGGAA